MYGEKMGKSVTHGEKGSSGNSTPIFPLISSNICSMVYGEHGDNMEKCDMWVKWRHSHLFRSFQKSREGWRLTLARTDCDGCGTIAAPVQSVVTRQAL